VTSTSPDGSFEQAANPLALALAAGATFVARGFAGDTKALAELIAVAVRHRGYAIVDILQPCVTFNKRNTYDFFRDRLYDLSGAGHDTSNRVSAFAKALEWGEHIPTGIFYQADLPGYEEQVAALQEGPLAKRPLERLTPEQVEGLLAEFV
jgi:2-oxoglutarate ferredoxin oxidoreductase subunit beta